MYAKLLTSRNFKRCVQICSYEAYVCIFLLPFSCPVVCVFRSCLSFHVFLLASLFVAAVLPFSFLCWGWRSANTFGLAHWWVPVHTLGTPVPLLGGGQGWPFALLFPFSRSLPQNVLSNTSFIFQLHVKHFCLQISVKAKTSSSYICPSSNPTNCYQQFIVISSSLSRQFIKQFNHPTNCYQQFIIHRSTVHYHS